MAPEILNLTITYGVRWELVFPETVSAPGSGSELNLNTGQVDVFGTGLVSSHGYQAMNWHNFGPRHGVAYRLGKKTVIRTGYGWTYSLGTFGSTFGHNVTQNPPVLANQSLSPRDRIPRSVQHWNVSTIFIDERTGMTTAEVLLEDFDSEMSNTRRTLERVPEEKPEYRAHDKSMPMGKLAMHCATLPLFGTYLVEDEGMDLAAPKHPHSDLTFTSREECLKQFDQNAAKCRAALAVATNEQLAALWRFSFGEHLISNDSRSSSFRRMFFNHLVHHVAQLGVYLRLNGVPVPALYGPSADEQWSPK